ncbi:MAG: hypothetical protein ACLVJH_05260 [Faecalibacterium prausnitzii]
MPPIQTAGMSSAEQKQLPDAVRQTILAALITAFRPFHHTENYLMASYRYERDIDPKTSAPANSGSTPGRSAGPTGGTTT